MRGGRSGSSVVKLLHRTHANTPTRCDLMMAEPSEDWNVFKQIFADHWDEFKHAHPRYQTAYYEGLVAKMLGCGNSEQMGYVEYRCLQCGQGTHRVAMSCKSSLCLRCAKVHVDNWVSQVSTMLHEGVIYRHIILTVPAMFRTTFSHNAAVLLSALMRCGVQCLERHRDHIDDATYKELGLPMGSGMVESACKWLIQQRFKGVGMRWSEEGFNHLLHLRLAWVNGSFEALFQLGASPNR